MKRFLITSCIVGFLMATSPVMADSWRGHGHPPGLHKQIERGKWAPPGHQKKFLSSRHREHRYDRDHRRDKHWNKHQKRHHGKHGYSHRDRYRDRRDYRGGHDKYRSGYQHSYRGYDGRLSPEQRVGRIIRDTQVLIEASRR